MTDQTNTPINPNSYVAWRSYDAGQKREWLLHERVQWSLDGYWAPFRVSRYESRVRQLARIVGLSYEQVRAELETDCLNTITGEE